MAFLACTRHGTRRGPFWHRLVGCDQRGSAAGIAGPAACASAGREAQRMSYAGGQPAVCDGGRFATPIGNTAASAPPGTAEASGARHFASKCHRSAEPEFCATAASGVRQIRPALPLAKEAGGVTDAVVEIEIGAGACGAASVGLFQRHENRAQLRGDFAGAKISHGSRSRVRRSLAGSGKR